MSDPAIATYGLSKRYGSILAVDDVDLRVAKGDIYGFLGLNGAGKSTTIRMLLGMIQPSQGHAEIFGNRVTPDATGLWERVGHLVEFATAYPQLTVRENLEIARRLQGQNARTAVSDVIEQLGLSAYVGRRASQLSLGNLQRLALARALLHRPSLLILDEPANGLDPAGVIEIRALLRRLAEENGVTVLMSSHVLGEVARLATRNGIIHRGRLVEELDAGELELRLERRLELSTRDLAAAQKALSQKGFAPRRGEANSGQPLLVLCEQGAISAPDEIARILTEAGMPPTHLVVVQEDLEAHFMELVSKAEGNSE